MFSYFFQKFKSWQAVFMKTSTLSDVQREMWKKVMTPGFMSSEESGEEERDGEKRAVIKVKVLPWRAPKVDRFFKTLDQKASKKRSRQSQQQTLPRVIGGFSCRPKPASYSDDFFGFVSV